MSSPRQKIAVAIAAVVAVSVLGLAVLRDEAADSSTPDALVGTVVATSLPPLDVVELSTPEQAAIAVSSRLFETADMAILTESDAPSRDAAIATAKRLKVPILLDDPAAPAELTRLRTSQVLTFGIVDNVVGATPAETEPEALEAQVAALESVQPAASPHTADAVVLMKSAKKFAVAATAVKIAGATVLEAAEGDLRQDAKTAAALAQRPDSSVIALGAPFVDEFAYSLDVVQNDATQIGGGYFALSDRRFVGLHGTADDPTSGVLGRQSLAKAVDRIQDVAARFAENDSVPTVPLFELVVDDSEEVTPKSLKPVIDAAEKADLYVLIHVQMPSSALLKKVKTFKDLLQRPHVGLTLEPTGSKKATAEEINGVATWLADLTAKGGLPQKLFVVRESSRSAISDRKDIDTSRPELAVVLDVDVAGEPGTKLSAWKAARSGAPKGASFGWRQFTQRDEPMLTVKQIYQLVAPLPAVIIYQ